MSPVRVTNDDCADVRGEHRRSRPVAGGRNRKQGRPESGYTDAEHPGVGNERPGPETGISRLDACGGVDRKLGPEYSSSPETGRLITLDSATL